ncbi:hypothetical protein NSU_2053 [Novosphingobium pentaromativorans US6-1]|uniref:Uncharacterized protein n=1 Tax=Novosphingobium pentaromativorans US6-1 TaxID=1088721 RepID=G6ECI2_9SPHN|nr:hypothetical protein NSU_2053 [Novosphingobium pentaromativorans US6-1]
MMACLSSSACNVSGARAKVFLPADGDQAAAGLSLFRLG